MIMTHLKKCRPCLAARRPMPLKSLGCFSHKKTKQTLGYARSFIACMIKCRAVEQCVCQEPAPKRAQQPRCTRFHGSARVFVRDERTQIPARRMRRQSGISACSPRTGYTATCIVLGELRLHCIPIPRIPRAAETAGTTHGSTIVRRRSRAPRAWKTHVHPHLRCLRQDF